MNLRRFYGGCCPGASLLLGLLISSSLLSNSLVSLINSSLSELLVDLFILDALQRLGLASSGGSRKGKDSLSGVLGGGLNLLGG